MQMYVVCQIRSHQTLEVTKHMYLLAKTRQDEENIYTNEYMIISDQLEKAQVKVRLREHRTA